MDSDLFQILTLTLLGAVIALLIAIAVRLTGIRRALRGSVKATSSDESSGSLERTESEPAAATETMSSAHKLKTDATTDAPDEAVAANVPDGPSEQPFEHEGRWWFRRTSGELLVYDEWAAEWTVIKGVAGTTESSEPRDLVEREPETAVPATTGEAAPTREKQGHASVAVETPDSRRLDTPMHDAVGDTGEGTGEEAAAPLEPVAVGAQHERQTEGFWKCSSCGAINGLKATTCRLCFAARG